MGLENTSLLSTQLNNCWHWIWGKGESREEIHVKKVRAFPLLEWVAVSFSRGSSKPRDRTQVSCITGRFFPTEPLGNGYTFIEKYYIARKCYHYLNLQQVLVFLQWRHQRSLITDHQNRYYNNNNNNNEKAWNIMRITKPWHRDRKKAKAVGKIALIDLLDAGLPQIFILLKKKKKSNICKAQLNKVCI